MQEIQGDASLIPGSGRSPGSGNSNPLGYSCLKNPMDRRILQSIGSQRVRYDSLSIQACMNTQETPGSSLALLPCEDTAERQPSLNQKADHQQAPNLPVPWSWTSRIQTCENKIWLFISHLGYDNLLKQPELTKTLSKTTIFSHKTFLTGSFPTSLLHSTFYQTDLLKISDHVIPSMTFHSSFLP